MGHEGPEQPELGSTATDIEIDKVVLEGSLNYYIPRHEEEYEVYQAYETCSPITGSMTFE